MKLIKMVCPSCGAKLDVDGDKKEFVCEYCHTTTLLDDGVIRVEHKIVDENSKEKLELFGNVAKGIGIMSIIPFIIFGIVFLVIIGIVVFSIFKFNNKEENIPSQGDNIIEDVSEEINKQYTEFEINKFNNVFEIYVGTEYGTSVGNLLDKVVTNNKTEKNHIITVIYGDKTTTDPNEIVSIKKSLEKWGEYEVSLDYDDNGFANKVTIS